MANAFNNKLLMVTSAELGKTAYCADPDAIININPTTPDGTNVPDNMPCGAIHGWINANYPPCPAGAGPGSNCFWTK